MNNLKYNLLLCISKIPFIGGGNSLIIKHLKREGCVIGENTHIFSNIASSEPYLVSIGSNCTISTDVIFLTHDASIGIYVGRDKYSDICGRITIGNNCFIGNRAIVLYGVSLPNNTIVAAGSVVTKSIDKPGCIIAGNPAKVIGYVDSFLSKSQEKFFKLHGLNEQERKSTILNSINKLVKRSKMDV
jgi:acetyltransferase-like isoleucine patch superfamily enzyme